MNDINTENTKKIEETRKEKGVEVVGKIPYDKYWVVGT